MGRKIAETIYSFLDFIVKEDEASHKELYKNTGITKSEGYIQFLLQNGFIAEIINGEEPFYSVTKQGRELYKILLKDNLFKIVLKTH